MSATTPLLGRVRQDGGSMRAATQVVSAAIGAGTAQDNLMRQQSIAARRNAAERMYVSYMVAVTSAVPLACIFIIKLIFWLVIWSVLNSARHEPHTYLRTYLKVYVLLSMVDAVMTIFVSCQTICGLSRAGNQLEERGGLTASQTTEARIVAVTICCMRATSVFSLVYFANTMVAIFVLIYHPEFKDSAPILHETVVWFIAIDIVLYILPLILGACIACCLVPILAINAGNFQPPVGGGNATTTGTTFQSHHEAPTSHVAVMVPPALVTQETVTEANNELPQFRFRRNSTPPLPSSSADASSIPGAPSGGVITRMGSEHVRQIISNDEAHCAICWTMYKDGADIHELPCEHHFHTNCLSKWMGLSHTCPICSMPLNMPDTSTVP